jgi:ELWxxDGT repeat protein
MARTRFLVSVCTACVVGSGLVPGVAQAARLLPTATPPARPTASLVDDLAPGPASSTPRDLTAMNGRLFFTAWTPGHGRQLWRTDGTVKGTVMLTHVRSPVGANPQDLTVANGVLFFAARDPLHGQELWKSDGTAAGTGMVRDIVRGPGGSDPVDITYAVGQQLPNPINQVLVYFSASSPGHGRQLWKSNGTAAGTVMVTNVNPRRAGLAPEDIAPVAGTTAMFSGDDGVHGREPWVTDGTSAGTHMYEDLNPGPAGSNPADITPAAFDVGILQQLPLWYFSAKDGGHGREFFVAYENDPPADVYDINPGRSSSNPGPFDSVAAETGLLAATTATRGRLLFDVQQPPMPPVVSGPHPGTASEVPGVGPGKGSNPVLAPTNEIGFASDLPVTVTRTYFVGDDAGHGRQLWQADEFVVQSAGEAGTLSFDVTGLRLVRVINSAGAALQDLTSVGGTPVFEAATGATEVFSANDGKHGRELWFSDGWFSNTHLAADVNPGPAGSDPQDITVVGQVAYFTALDPAHGRELWKLTVPPSPRLFLLGPLTSVKAGASVNLTVTLPPASGAQQPIPTGSVTFYEDGTKIGTRPLMPQASGGETASLTIAARSGTHQAVAVYSGDGTFLPATSNTNSITGT